jgi:hypothetical protein
MPTAVSDIAVCGAGLISGGGMPYDRAGVVQRHEDQALLQRLRKRRFWEHEAGHTLRIPVQQKVETPQEVRPPEATK